MFNTTEKNKTEEQMELIEKGNSNVMVTEPGEEIIDIYTLLDELITVGINLSDIVHYDTIGKFINFARLSPESLQLVRVCNWLVVFKEGTNVDYTLNPRVIPLMVKDGSVAGQQTALTIHGLYISTSPLTALLTNGSVKVNSTFEEVVQALQGDSPHPSQSDPQTALELAPGETVTVYVATIISSPQGNAAAMQTLDYQYPLAA